MVKKLLIGTIALAATSTTGVVVADNQIDPYVGKETHYELAVTNELDQTDAVKIAKDEPAFTLEKWGGEAAITIRRAGDFETSKRNPLSKRREIDSTDGKETVLIEPVRQALRETDDGVKIDILLHEKPETNAFSFQIEGAENFDFFYQPELTPEEIAEGTVRPENVVGSYAVYHKTRRNHKQGETNYATGKAYHIYRPKVIDADGVEIWAELVLTVRLFLLGFYEFISYCIFFR